uniref:Uncharacterized protein n=1 Tax=Avena sativa TaxID=4498 RepID=A0ACD5Z8M2_AVESA
MSKSDSCEDDPAQIRNPATSRPSRSAGDAPRQEKYPTLTSRSSVKHACEVIQGFSEYKRWLVREVGWGGMLEIPSIQKINLKFSAWIMEKIDVRSRSIVLTENKVLRFWHQDVHKVFGVPCGPRNVIGRDANIRADAIEFIKNTLGMNQAGAHSLKAAENFLTRDITEESSKIEKDCFQIALVIFVMGHILAPSIKHDYATIDFWGALADTENIGQFNWCEYILQSLLDAVGKYKTDVRNNSHAINLFGCHLWLQVFLLDNLDLGIFNKKHDVIPRIKAFDADWIRRLITMASDICKGPRSYSSTPATDPLTLMLKELNAKALLHIHNTRVGVLNDMFSFTEKLMAHLSTQCICCNARGFSDCPLNAQITTDDALARTPVNAKLSGVRLDMSDNEGSTSRQSAGSSKRPPLAPDSDAISKKKKPSDVRGESAHSNLCRSSDNIIEQAVYIFNQIASNYNSDQDDPNGPAVFGKLTKVLPRRHPIFHYSYAANPNPWRAGRAPPPLKPDIADELAKALMQIPSEEIERYWIVHDTPSLVCVRGHALREQLAGDGNFEHELMCVALRRYSQVDSEVDQGCPYLNWRIILEADFATLVLAGKDYLRSVHVQSQLIGGHIKFSIACCQFVSLLSH